MKPLEDLHFNCLNASIMHEFSYTFCMQMTILLINHSLDKAVLPFSSPATYQAAKAAKASFEISYPVVILLYLTIHITFESSCTNYCTPTIVHQLLYNNYCTPTIVHQLLYNNYCTPTIIHQLLYTNYCTPPTIIPLFVSKSWTGDIPKKVIS